MNPELISRSPMSPTIIRAFPPNYNELVKHFNIRGLQGIVYAYGERIYNPSGKPLAPWIFDHENTHCTRQIAQGICEWWEQYALDAEFRLSEEVLAHRKEYASFAETHNFKDAARYLEMMISRLSGPLYKHMVTSGEARTLIVTTSGGL